MSQKPAENIGVADAYLRLFGGLTLLALGAGRKLGRTGSILAVLFGASKVAEGITRYCPVFDLMELTSLDGSVRRRERTPSPGANESGDDTFVERSFPWDEHSPRTGSAVESSPAESSSPEQSDQASRQTIRRTGVRAWRSKSSAVVRSSQHDSPTHK